MPTCRFTLLVSVIMLLGFSVLSLPEAIAQVAPARIEVWDTGAASSHKFKPEDFGETDAWHAISRSVLIITSAIILYCLKR